MFPFIKRYLSVIFFAFGLILFFFLMQKVGWDKTWSTLQQHDWRLVFVFALPILWYGLQSVAWQKALKIHGAAVSLWSVFLGKIGGEAVNTVTPFSFLAGDPYRVYALNQKTSPEVSTASVVIDRTVQLFAVVLLLLVTLILAAFHLDLPEPWKSRMPLAVAGLLALVLLFVFFQKKGIFNRVHRLLDRLGLWTKHLDRLEDTFLSIDRKIARFYREHPREFAEMLLYHFLGRAMGVVENLLVAYLLGMGLTPVDAFYLSSLTILINMTFVFVPGSLGVMESGYGLLFHFLEFNPAWGVALQLTRRLRTFFWIGLGLLAILLTRPKKASSVATS